MQVILKPVTHPELGEIIIKGDLFAIGRHEIPFSGYEPGFVEKLSRRHARIFEQDGTVYIADLGSLNGTTVNGVNVDTSPVKLQRGDEICLTGSLCYQIEILGAVAAKQTSEEPAMAALQLILTPVKQQSILEPIVVTQFPFLVNKSSDVFSRYKDSLPAEAGFISRRHAHIFLNDRDVYIEDLGSTNGTFIGDDRLEEHARKLEDGDVIAFGGDTFAYRVGLIRAGDEPADTAEEKSELLTGTAHALEDPTRTTFVTSANSFLDIYCAESDVREDDSFENRAVAGTVGLKAKKDAVASGGFLHKYRSIFGEVRNAFSDGKESASGKIWLVAIVILAALGTGIYYYTSSGQQLRELLEQGAYAEALIEANRFLELHPDSEDVRELATEAALKEIVPGWIELLTAGDFAQAEQQIEKGKRMSDANPQSQQLFDALLWVTRLERFVDERGGPESPVIMFDEEQTISELVQWWDEDSKGRRRSLSTIAQYVPDFMSLRPQVFSHLRAMQNQESLSVEAIQRLQQQVRDHLQQGDAQSLHDILDDFQSKYPRIRGVQAVRDDLEKYLAIESELQATRWIRAQRMAADTVFETPVFQERVSLIAREQLPTESVMRRYRQAQVDWQEGDTEKAIAALALLKKERWGEVAERILQQKQAVISDFQQLRQSRDKPGYDRQLLTFYRTLDPVEDVYFAATVEEEFQLYRGKALDKAERLFTAARSSWTRYQKEGGIRGLHRLQASVTPAFRTMAAALTEAYDSINEAIEIHRLLKIDNHADWEELYARVTNEVRLQRQSLNELEMVLEPSLRQAKLELLPTLSSQLTGEKD